MIKIERNKQEQISEAVFYSYLWTRRRKHENGAGDCLRVLLAEKSMQEYNEVDMASSRKILVVFLIGLFLSFSFNAYACLVPIYSGMKVSEGSDCSKPGEEPASQFCKGFKSLAVQSGPDVSSLGLSHFVHSGSTASNLAAPVTTSQFLTIPAGGHLVPSRDILVLISVFRI
ncbi:MAG: hypothetical protein NPIRA02_01060 [Nitrospirales bacterium]|nr:MAG: hypothetical protein NPIRA02_01060 [Nitrospirales bacterium]